MTTIILGLGALTIVMGYVVRVKDKTISIRENEIEQIKKEKLIIIRKLNSKHAAEKEKGGNMLTTDVSEILLNLGNKLKENPNDLMVRVEVKEKLNRIVEDMEG